MVEMLSGSRGGHIREARNQQLSKQGFTRSFRTDGDGIRTACMIDIEALSHRGLGKSN